MEESRQMATMEDKTHGAQPDYLQVAKLLQEKLSTFLEGGSGEVPEEKLRRLLYMAASHEVVSYTLMNPVLWGSLPRELLPLVMARLPVPEIIRLRCQLSKEWTMNMEFNRACDEANPNVAALFSYVGQANEFSVRIFDFSKYVWLYVYRFRLTNRGNAPSWFDSAGSESVWLPMAGYGGLVCFVSTWNYTEANPLCIVVINPLRHVQHELPPLQHVYTVPPTLVHLKVDSKTKGYKVVVVGKKKGRHTVETYDSVSRQWSRVAPSWGRILGHACKWKIRNRNSFRLKSSSLCAYDLEEGRLELFDCNLLFPSEGAWVKHSALAGDRMFGLHETLNRHDIGSGFYFITEFQSQNSAEVSVPVKTHGRCTPAKEGCPLALYACEDVLMVLMHEKSGREHGEKQRCCFVDFSRDEWHYLPEFSQGYHYPSLMCRVFWNVIP